MNPLPPVNIVICGNRSFDLNDFQTASFTDRCTVREWQSRSHDAETRCRVTQQTPNLGITLKSSSAKDSSCANHVEFTGDAARLMWGYLQGRSTAQPGTPAGIAFLQQVEANLTAQRKGRFFGRIDFTSVAACAKGLTVAKFIEQIWPDAFRTPFPGAEQLRFLSWGEDFPSDTTLVHTETREWKPGELIVETQW